MSSNKRKNALITGAAKRIGREIAIVLAESGWNVAVHYNKTKPDAEISIQGDLNNMDDIRRIIPEARKKLGGEISLLINNASVFEKINFANTTEEIFDLNMNLHVKVPFFLAQEFAKQTTDGQIINMLDTNIVRNKTTYFAYLLSKKSLGALTRMLAVELAPNIRVNALLPGITELSSQFDQEYMNKRVESLPLKRKVKIKEICDVLITLANSGCLTGQEIFIDGGEHLI